MFYAETDDKIIFVQNSQRTSQADQCRAGPGPGGSDWNWPPALPARMIADREPHLAAGRGPGRPGLRPTQGNKLPFLPDVEAQARLKWRPPAGWRPGSRSAYLGANYRDRANTELNKAPARTLLNLGLARDWHSRLAGARGRVVADRRSGQPDRQRRLRRGRLSPARPLLAPGSSREDMNMKNLLLA